MAAMDIVQALNAKFQADKLKAIANLSNYLNNAVGVGEHPDVVEECEKLVTAITDANGKIETLNEILPKNIENNK